MLSSKAFQTAAIGAAALSAGIALSTKAAIDFEDKMGGVLKVMDDMNETEVKALKKEILSLGQVLPIGGLKEKLLAAHRAGIKQVLIPKDNEKNLVDIPKKVIDDIKITPVNSADEVLKIALTKELKPTEWVEVDKISDNKKSEKTQASIQ